MVIGEETKLVMPFNVDNNGVRVNSFGFPNGRSFSASTR